MILKCKVFKIKIKLCKHLHFNNTISAPSGNEKFYTHLCSSSSLEHLAQTQEICHISSQVVKCKDRKCGYLDKANLLCLVYFVDSKFEIKTLVV